MACISPEVNTVKLNFCVGHNRVNNGTWYLVRGVRPADGTYCEFCVENGCVDKDNVFKLPGPIKDCNCVCEGKHFAVTFVCPTCTGLLEFTPDTKYPCQNCKIAGIRYAKYCACCSYGQKCCANCGETSKNFDEYFQMFQNIVSQLVTKASDTNHQLDDAVLKRLPKEEINDFVSWGPNMLKEYFVGRSDLITKKYANMSAEQIWQTVIDNRRKYSKAVSLI